LIDEELHHEDHEGHEGEEKIFERKTSFFVLFVSFVVRRHFDEDRE
jgi:hypothetical protein